MLIDLIKKNGTTLETGGKLLKEDITVFPKLQNKTITTNGKHTADPGYAGLGEVDIKVEGGGTIPDGYVPEGTVPDGYVPEGTIPDGYVKPSGTKLITANGSHDVKLFEKVDVQVEDNGSGGSGECDRTHVTEFEELPTDGLVEGEVYKVKKKALLSIAAYTEDGFIPDFYVYVILIFGALLGAEDATLPEGFYRYSEEIPTDTPDAFYDFYPACYVESEEMLYVYDPDVGAWVSAAETSDSDLPYIGSITSPDQVTEHGIYAFLGYEGSEFYEVVPVSYKLIGLRSDGTPFDLSALTYCEVIAVPSLPTENIKDSVDTCMYVYYVEGQEPFIHYNGEWILLSERTGASFGGIISDMTQATDEDSFYILTNNGGLMKYFHPEGTIAVSDPGFYDVATYSHVKVNEPPKEIFGKWILPRSLPTNLPNVSINFTATYQGVTYNYVGIEFDIMDNQFWYVREDGTTDLPYDLGGWGYGADSARIIDFGSTPQLVPGSFMPFLADAVPVYSIVNDELITFDFYSTRYIAKPGVTWREWVDSALNDSTYFIDEEDNTVRTSSEYVMTYNDIPVLATDTIIEGAYYKHQQVS